MFNEFTKAQFEEMRADIEKALSEVAKKYKCTVTAGSIKYSDILVNIDLQFKSGENAEDYERAAFEQNCRNFGFAPSDYLAPCVIQGNVYYLCGFLPRGRKYTVEIKDKQGKKYKITEMAVMAGIAAARKN